ncbi:MAG: hypothetical protein WC474_00105 [Hydrogenophilaceae bacterium]
MRAHGPSAKPVSRKGIRYEAIKGAKGRGLEQNGGYIAAIDESSDKELWILKVYDVVYDGEMEDDKQDVLITSLSTAWFGNRLIVCNERGEKFEVDLDSRAVSRK